MKSVAGNRAYRQGLRAETAEANTQRILECRVGALQRAALRPDHPRAGGPARAGVGFLTRHAGRIRPEFGLVRAVDECIQPLIGSARGEPSSADPASVAAALAPQYERWGALIDRTLRQEDVSPALAEGAEGGRAAHRAWIDAAFAEALAARRPAARRRLRARLVAVCGVELWLVLRRDEGLTVAEARDTVADLVSACLAGPRTEDHGKEQKR